MKKPSVNKRVLAPVLLVMALGVLGVRLPMAIADRAELYAPLDPIADVYALVNQHFFEEPDLRAMRDGAIEGMLEALDDPYTEFIPSSSVGDFDKYVRGQFVGIGASVRNEGGWVLIVSPLDDSPAYRAGVEAGDLVVAVDGESIYDMAVDKVIEEYLAGEAGTTVTLTIEREGDATDVPAGAKPASVPGAVGEAPGPMPGRVRFDLDIVRDRIVTSTVKGIHREGEEWLYEIDPERGLLYVRVTQFTGGTVDELRGVLVEHLEGGEIGGLILDLRFNGGGSLAAAIGMADLFLEEGLIVSQKGRSSREEAAYARERGTLPRFPMAVLVNEASASASEIVAGALSDNGRAVIVGTRTFGKGLVQSIYPLASGVGQLKITEQYYYLPSGRLIQREDDATEWGVDPTDGFYVPMTDDENREMLRRRREEEIIRADAAVEECCWDDPEWILEELKDPQLSAAVRALQGRVDDGVWRETGEAAPEGTLELAELRRQERLRNRLLRELERVQTRIDVLETVAAEGDAADERDLLPDDAALVGGTLTVRDAEGNPIADLKITGGTLERWLIDAPVEKSEGSSGGDGE